MWSTPLSGVFQLLPCVLYESQSEPAVAGGVSPRSASLSEGGAAPPPPLPPDAQPRPHPVHCTMASERLEGNFVRISPTRRRQVCEALRAEVQENVSKIGAGPGKRRKFFYSD
eukprot:gene9687-biopygen5170